MAEIKHTTIDKLVPDDKNFNKGTEFGKGLLDKSFSKFGAGRSILIDKNNRIIAGNKATESFGESGGEKVIVVETTGDTLVAVKRTDIDLDSKEGRELALADNATQKADLSWDEETIEMEMEVWDIDPSEWGIETEGEDKEGEASSPLPFVCKITFEELADMAAFLKEYKSLIETKFSCTVTESGG